ncbi:hypothetical protein [Planctomicrobium piriforme]|uniref:hypothetical protein n=1 Tax=Planctomicrobium piriforme TaxID=1576369 RepID=UPI0011139288|nr:hypothetical protein [Planctomicrobium piriforme]
MSAGKATPERFEPDEDVVEILLTLRENGMSWIADEVEQRISAGATEIVSIGRSRGKTEYEDQRPLTSDEQIETLIRCLHNYLVVLPQAWAIAQDNLLQSTDLRSITGEAQTSLRSISLAPSGISSSSITLIPRRSIAMTKQLEELLHKAWPISEKLKDKE